MSKDLNYCSFIGRLGRDIDLKYSASGSAIANLALACSDDYKDKNTGENVSKTNWINIVIFGKLAEIAGQYLKKGSKIFVSGKQVTRKWQDQSGADRYSTEIVIDGFQGQMIMLGDGQSNNQGGQQQNSQQPQQQRPAQQHAPQQQQAQQQQSNQDDSPSCGDDWDDIPF